MKPSEQVAVAVDNLENVIRGVISYQRAPLEAKIATLKRISYPEPQPIETIAGQIADAPPDGIQGLIELAAGQAEQARISLHSRNLRDVAISVLRARLSKFDVQMDPVRRVKTLTSSVREQAAKIMIDKVASGLPPDYTASSLARHFKANLDEARRVLTGFIDSPEVANAAADVLAAIDAFETAVIDSEGI